MNRRMTLYVTSARRRGEENLARVAVIDRVRPHVGGGSDAVRHVEEAGDRRNVPDIAVEKSGAPQPLAVSFLHARRRSGELDREVEHGALSLVQARDTVIHHHVLAKQRIPGILPVSYTHLRAHETG